MSQLLADKAGRPMLDKVRDAAEAAYKHPRATAHSLQHALDGHRKAIKRHKSKHTLKMQKNLQLIQQKIHQTLMPWQTYSTTLAHIRNKEFAKKEPYYAELKTTKYQCLSSQTRNMSVIQRELFARNKQFKYDPHKAYAPESNPIAELAKLTGEDVHHRREPTASGLTSASRHETNESY